MKERKLTYAEYRKFMLIDNPSYNAELATYEHFNVMQTQGSNTLLRQLATKNDANGIELIIADLLMSYLILINRGSSFKWHKSYGRYESEEVLKADKNFQSLAWPYNQLDIVSCAEFYADKIYPAGSVARPMRARKAWIKRFLTNCLDSKVIKSNLITFSQPVSDISELLDAEEDSQIRLVEFLTGVKSKISTPIASPLFVSNDLYKLPLRISKRMNRYAFFANRALYLAFKLENKVSNTKEEVAELLTTLDSCTAAELVMPLNELLKLVGILPYRIWKRTITRSLWSVDYWFVKIIKKSIEYYGLFKVQLDFDTHKVKVIKLNAADPCSNLKSADMLESSELVEDDEYDDEDTE